MTVQRAALAVPGDLNMLTGGYIYDRRLLHELRAMGLDVSHVALPASFPDPSEEDMVETFRLLAEIPPDCPVIIDGLAFGAFDPQRMSAIRAPIIALIHHPLAKENGLDPARQAALFETERANLAFAEQVLVPSPHTAKILVADYDVPAQKITIARPGTDRPKTPRQPSDPPLILSVGIQLPRKGHDVLLNALALIKDVAWHAMIVGAPLDQAYARELEDLRRSLDLVERVTLAGQLERDSLDKVYSQATLFALATRYEGYGIVFDEALAQGLPIVSCNTGAVPDTVPSAAGRLVPIDAPAPFAAAMRELLTQPDEYQRVAAAALAAGAALPRWRDTANAALQSLSRIGPRR